MNEDKVAGRLQIGEVWVEMSIPLDLLKTAGGFTPENPELFMRECDARDSVLARYVEPALHAAFHTWAAQQ